MNDLDFSGKRVLVVGDVMLDRYVCGKVSRLSPDAPVPVVDVNATFPEIVDPARKIFAGMVRPKMQIFCLKIWNFQDLRFIYESFFNNA